MSYASYTLSGRQANLYGLLFVVPFLILTFVPYLIIWCDLNDNSLQGLLLQIVRLNMPVIRQVIDLKWLVLLLFLAGVMLHEIIHGICMAAFAKNGWKSVKFGFNIKAFAPYAHCKEPLSPFGYKISLAMPGMILGDIPMIISWCTGNIMFLLFGFFFYIAASGDLVLLWMSRNITDGMLQDHAEKIGFEHIE